MRLHEWQDNPKLLKAAAELAAKNDTFIRMMELLIAESPLKNPLPPNGVTADDRSHRLGLIEGYQQCLANIESLRTPQRKISQIVPTYQPPELPE